MAKNKKDLDLADSSNLNQLKVDDVVLIFCL